jgi:hypothetical protein
MVWQEQEAASQLVALVEPMMLTLLTLMALMKSAVAAVEESPGRVR